MNYKNILLLEKIINCRLSTDNKFLLVNLKSIAYQHHATFLLRLSRIRYSMKYRYSILNCNYFQFKHTPIILGFAQLTQNQHVFYAVIQLLCWQLAKLSKNQCVRLY